MGPGGERAGRRVDAPTAVLACLVRAREGQGNLLDSIQEAVWILDTSGTVAYVNPKLADLLGYAVDDMVGRSYLVFVPTDARPEAASRFDDRVRTPSDHREIELVRADGARTWIRVSSSPLHAADGTIIGALVIGADIDQERRIRIERLQQTERMAALAELSDELISVASDETQVLDVIARRTSDLLSSTVVIQTRDGNGELETTAVHSQNPERVHLVATAFAKSLTARPGTELHRALATGRPYRWSNVTAAMLEAALTDPPDLPADLAPLHLLLVPLRVGVDPIGLLTVKRRADQATFTDDDVSLAKAVADRASMAISQAQGVAELERRSAEAEQAAVELRQTVALLGQALDDRRALSTRLVTAQREERRRIAGDIHDDSIQALAALGLRLQLLRRHIHDPGDIEIVDGVASALVGATGRLRNLLFDLRPPSGDLELMAVLESVACELIEPRGLEWTVSAAGSVDLSHEVVISLYRVIREALINVANHADATAVTLTAEGTEDAVTIRIRDDGAGFDPSTARRPGHLGLLNMDNLTELLGGTLEIESEIGTGTELRIRVPRDHSDPLRLHPAADPPARA